MKKVKRIIGKIKNQKKITEGHGIRVLKRLVAKYGEGNWKKMKGWARVELENGTILVDVEVHWYETHGKGKKEIKIP